MDIGQIQQLTTTGTSSADYTYWPNNGSCGMTTSGYIYVSPQPEPPKSCSGDVHVFPCPHCDKCKCGAATVKRPKAKAK